LLEMLATFFTLASATQLCANNRGIFLGLAADEYAYTSVAGNVDPDEVNSVSQKWELTVEGEAGPQHSYTEHYLQVLPDTGRSYPKRGHHMKNPKELENVSPYVSFSLRVTKEGAGLHTLFVRWTGGDTIGGGDSLYVLMDRIKGKTRSSVTGELTIKPAVIPVDSGMSHFAGCCYDMITHACPCFIEKPDDASCPTNLFIGREKASGFGVQCFVGGGAMEIVHAPRWYLFAGQDAGDVMDFDSEPWDATCEANGSNTKDSGRGFPSWDLEQGDYALKIYAREDGTALDGIYMAGPSGSAPSISLRYKKGDSTICNTEKISTTVVVFGAFFAVLVCGTVGFYAWLKVFSGRANATLQDGEPSVEVMTGQVVRYVTVDNS